MKSNIYYKIKSDPNCLKYLKENSYWYKYLNRDERYYQMFLDNMRKKYNLTVEDRVNKISSTIDGISKIMDILK